MPWDENLEGIPRRIAATDASPLRVLAGPGTGKTYSLMRRVMRLLESGCNPAKVMVCTFTRTASKDLQRELRKLSIPGIDEVWASTIHSYCFSLLSKGDVFDITGRSPRPLLDFEQRFLLEDLSGANDEGVNGLRKRIVAFTSAWARLQSESPGWPRTAEDRECLRVLKPWLIFHRAMLIGELVTETLSYLRNNPASTHFPSFRHVLIDEYQDLNKAEQVLLDLIARSATITVLGDEDQSIYSFKHAHPEGISQFDTEHPGTTDDSLNECRRCPRLVVLLANELISHNLSRTDRALTAREANAQGEVFVVQWPDMTAEANGLSQFIKERIESKSVVAGNVLVLSPRRQFGYAIRDALSSLGIPAHSFFHEQVLEGNPKKEGDYSAQEAFTLLTLLAKPTDRVALRCWIGFGSASLRKAAWARIRQSCEASGQDPQSFLDDLAKGRVKMQYVTPLVARYRTLVTAREHFAELVGQELVDALFPEAEEWAVPIRELATELGPEDGAAALLELLQRNITQPELPTDVNYVRIMSLHKSKGLTAQMVIISGVVDGLIPTVDLDLPREEYDRQLEEQRRLFYVALTRTTGTLVLSSISTMDGALAHRIGVSTRMIGTTIETISSQFMNDLGPQCPRAIAGEELR
jgi:DNA helicase-2/ATP-dependent DNA helicase PcrA